MKKPIVWTMAGVDPLGLSGTLVDLETFKQFRVEACAIITAVTAQNTCGITAIESISPLQIETQCRVLEEEFKPDSVKIGMLGNIKTQDKILQFLKHYSGLSVLDPVFNSSLGNSLIVENEKVYINHLIRLFPYVNVLTPNLTEAEKILNKSIISYVDIQRAAQDLLALGAKSVLIKGGHFEGDVLSQDYWTNGQESFWLSNKRMPNKQYRGTGCTLSSAIAACLALGYTMKDTLVIAKMYVHRGICNSTGVVKNTARLFHGPWPENQRDLPYLSSKPLISRPPSFKTCQIGLYPVVDSSDWLEKLLPLGVKTIQLRIKDLQGEPLAREIKRAVMLSKKFSATLFINDYWELAIQYGADGVHLGQEDLTKADIAKIRQSGLYLGISTHCYYEVAAAHAFSPSYIACGPIYFTTSKIMPFNPQGVEQLMRWRKTLQYPLVAIGGINLERLPSILKTKVDGIALISAITKAADFGVVTQQFLNLIREHAYE